MLSTEINKYNFKPSKPININNLKNNDDNLKNNDDNLKNNDDKLKNNNSNIDAYISKDENKLNNNNIDYKLDFNKFDPSKFSPPDNWTLRLKTRLNNYNYLNNDFNKFNKNNDNYLTYFFDNK